MMIEIGVTVRELGVGAISFGPLLCLLALSALLSRLCKTSPLRDVAAVKPQR